MDRGEEGLIISLERNVLFQKRQRIVAKRHVAKDSDVDFMSDAFAIV